MDANTRSYLKAQILTILKTMVLAMAALNSPGGKRVLWYQRLALLNPIQLHPLTHDVKPDRTQLPKLFIADQLRIETSSTLFTASVKQWQI